VLAVVGLEVTIKGSRTGTIQRWGGEFQILRAAMLKMQVPNDVRPKGAERRLVLESL